jgi:hypothetical protein
MRRPPLAVMLVLVAAVLWPQAGRAQDDAPVSKEQEALNKQREQLQRVYRWLMTLSLSWELHQYKRPPQPGQPALPSS